jgi:hypothetical protein
MYSPHLQLLMAQAHIEKLNRSRQPRNARPITTNERIAARHRNAVKLPAYLARAIERFIGHPVPETYAF